MVYTVHRLLSSKSQARTGLVDWIMINGKEEAEEGVSWCSSHNWPATISLSGISIGYSKSLQQPQCQQTQALYSEQSLSPD